MQYFDSGRRYEILMVCTSTEILTVCKGLHGNRLFTYAKLRHLREIIFILCNFAGLRVIGEASISRNYGVI